jgi:hypothetical protein
MKVVEITTVMVLGSVEDERTFINLTFMKNKLCNQLTTHLDLCVHIFTQNFYIVTNFSYDAAIVAWKEVWAGPLKVGVQFPWRRSYLCVCVYLYLIL